MNLSEKLQYFIEYYKDPQNILLKAVKCYRDPYYVRLLEAIIKLEDDNKILKAGIDYLINQIRIAHPQPIDLKRNPNMTVKEWLEKEINTILGEHINEISSCTIDDIVDTYGKSDWNEVPEELQDKIESKAYTLRKNLINSKALIKNKLNKFKDQYSQHFLVLAKDLFTNIKPGDSFIL